MGGNGASARPRRSSTVSDVAALAGVSPGTVSKALNGRGQLRAETRRRVIDAAEELGFSPNLVARGLIAGRTYTVGVLTTDSFGRFTIPVVLGAEDAMGAGEMAVLLCDGRGDPIREQHYVRTLLARRVDGIIVTGRSSDPRPPLGRDLPVPVVYALARSQDPDDVSIVHDDEQGAALGTEHLLSTGRRRIAHLTGAAHHAATQHRAAGVARALAEAGEAMVLGRPLVGQWSERWGREATVQLLRSGEAFDGVVAGSDQVARGVASALRDAGRRVPEEVGVVGFDNWDVMVEGSRPPLTTVDPNLTELGHVAASTLLEAINGRPVVPGVRRLPCRLVTRRSTEID
jgi:LacI family transcriptional regulator